MEEGLQGENGVDMDDDAASDDSSASETDLQQQITELEATVSVRRTPVPIVTMKSIVLCD